MADIVIDGTTPGANRFLILDSTGKIPAVDGSQVTAIAAGNIATGTIPIARIDTGSTANKIVVLDGSGRLPAVSGALLTNVSSSTNSASDPTVSTNPSGGVGTEWHNTTSGECYICTDATTGANVWTNIGAGSGDVAPFHFTNAALYCFAPGGNTTGDSNRATIDKNTFAADGNSTDQGDLIAAKRGISHSSSTTHGYSTSGYDGSGFVNVIERFAMGSPANSIDVGDLTGTGQTNAGITSSAYGFAAGGSPASIAQRVDKYSFATATANSTSLGDLISVDRNYPVGGSSDTHGYIMGSYSGAPVGQIEKWSFADNSTTANVGDLVTTSAAASHMQTGYIWTSGLFTGTATNQIDKMATASDSDSVDSGSDLSVTLNSTAAGNSSSTYGYCMGGNVAGSHADVVDKWPFASSSTATDVGNLTLVREGIMANGCQI